jgi:hypothetical protein
MIVVTWKTIRQVWSENRRRRNTSVDGTRVAIESTEQGRKTEMLHPRNRQVQSRTKKTRDDGPTQRTETAALWTHTPDFQAHTLEVDIAVLPRSTRAQRLVVKCRATGGRAVEQRFIEVEAIMTVPAAEDMSMPESLTEPGKSRTKADIPSVPHDLRHTECHQGYPSIPPPSGITGTERLEDGDERPPIFPPLYPAAVTPTATRDYEQGL